MRASWWRLSWRWRDRVVPEPAECSEDSFAAYPDVIVWNSSEDGRMSKDVQAESIMAPFIHLHNCMKSNLRQTQGKQASFPASLVEMESLVGTKNRKLYWEIKHDQTDCSHFVRNSSSRGTFHKNSRNSPGMVVHACSNPFTQEDPNLTPAQAMQEILSLIR